MQATPVVCPDLLNWPKSKPPPPQRLKQRVLLMARCPGAGGNEVKSPRGQGWKRVLGDPKAERKQSLCHIPSPDPPSQPNHLPQPPGYGRELGKTTKPISSRNIHRQLEPDEHPRCPLHWATPLWPSCWARMQPQVPAL